MSSPARVRVLLFGAFQDAAGAAEFERELPRALTVDELWQSLRAERPALGALAPQRLNAVNLDFSSGDRVLADGDEVAFFPPVSGG
jgi:molybdopterin synthase sulfur carrier subunit